MSPAATLLFALSLVCAGGVVASGGLRVHSLGPAALLVVGWGWNLWMDWLRYRSWLRHRQSGFAPSTQHLHLLGLLGAAACTVGALVWTLLAISRLRE